MMSINQIVTFSAVAAGAAVLATGAFASPAQFTDAQYIAAAHCQGLYDSHALGPVNAKAFDKMMEAQGEYRLPEVLNMADEARQSALTQAHGARGDGRTELVNERDGACAAWVSSSAVAAGR